MVSSKSTISISMRTNASWRTSKSTSESRKKRGTSTLRTLSVNSTLMVVLLRIAAARIKAEETQSPAHTGSRAITTRRKCKQPQKKKNTNTAHRCLLSHRSAHGCSVFVSVFKFSITRLKKGESFIRECMFLNTYSFAMEEGGRESILKGARLTFSL